MIYMGRFNVEAGAQKMASAARRNGFGTEVRFVEGHAASWWEAYRTEEKPMVRNPFTGGLVSMEFAMSALDGAHLEAEDENLGAGADREIEAWESAISEANGGQK